MNKWWIIVRIFHINSTYTFKNFLNEINFNLIWVAIEQTWVTVKVMFCSMFFKLRLWFTRREYGVDILGFMTEADYAKIIVWVETDEFDETEGPEHYTGCDYHPVRQIIHFSFEIWVSGHLSKKLDLHLLDSIWWSLFCESNAQPTELFWHEVVQRIFEVTSSVWLF